MTDMENSFKERGSVRLLYGWLVFAVSALVFAGVFAFLIAGARTPYIMRLFSDAGYVRRALVGHVILSFIIWFLAFEGALWTLAATDFLKKALFSLALGWAGLASGAAGMLLVIWTSLLGLGRPVFINYIPVLETPVFYAGLSLLALGMLATLVNSVLTMMKAAAEESRAFYRLVRFGLAVSGVSVFVALICFGLSFLSYTAAGEDISRIDLEAFFWGGGHMLQFANTIAMVSAWLYLARNVFKTAPIRSAYGLPAFALFGAFVAAAPLIYIFYGIGSPGYRYAFTKLMQWGLGPSTGVFAIAVVSAIRTGTGNRLPWKNPEFSSLIASMALFAMGGVISFTIGGYNTKIPAHYHGVIGAVTVSFMGMTYYLIKALGREIYSPWLASIQPYVYGIGQALFVIGMFWAGSRGVARKSFGAAQGLDDPVKVLSMIVFGLGGLVAITGGVMFVLNAGISLLRRRPGRVAAGDMG
ncbi:MAG: cbb3-type cytochrome c oxidase subunit I [Deltaproteobacteria bacterium]|nr:cbb3-type cytochrome c oxidase subunit I [Deltaproteobacteria bacterium]